MLGFLAALSTASAEQWPGWRGPTGDGVSRDPQLPTTWSEQSDNIRWKVEIPGQGYSSPIVWNDAIFLTTCIQETGDRILLRLDRETGREVWRKTVVTAPLETLHKLNSHASGTPATDGETVYVAFLEVGAEEIDAPNVGTPRPVKPGRMVVAAYGFDGTLKWIVRPGQFISVHGFCSCPVLYRNLVILNGDHDGDSYLVALNKSTGETVWKTPRNHKTRSYVTPLIREVDGKDQLVLSGSRAVAGFDPQTGTLLWEIDGPTEQFVASLVHDGSQFYLAAGFPTYHVMKVRANGTGNVTDTHVSWHVTDAKCYVPSPVLVDGLLLVADDGGIGNCFDTATGERLWRERLGRHFSASLLTANGLVYFLADDGKTTVLKPTRSGAEILTENVLEGDFYASPAAADGILYLRSTTHLYAVRSR